MGVVFAVARSEIARVYVWRVGPGPKMSRTYWHAGVATRAGQWVDIGDSADAEGVTVGGFVGAGRSVGGLGALKSA